MQITTKYDINDEVHIPSLEVNGRVLSIEVTVYGTFYYVRYIKNGEVKKDNFLLEEISDKKEKAITGLGG